MKLHILAVALLTALPIAARQPQNVANLHDVDLVYYGSRYRNIAWDMDWARTHTVYTDTDGKTNYLFDTYLLLELHTGTGHLFEPAGHPDSLYNQIGSTKSDWSHIIDTMLAVPARNIDTALDEAARKIGQPKYKRQIIFFIPVPAYGQTNWGEINGKSMDFNRSEDRITACKWFIDTAKARFKTQHYKNLSLAGFYWLSEDTNSGRTILPEINAFVRNMGLKTIWIPYYRAEGATKWREMGFDAAYYQPNYAFPRRTVYKQRLYDACRFARQHGMYMELEYDMYAVTATNPKPNCANRLYDYMSVFKECGADTLPIAYYQDEGALHALRTSPDSADQRLYRSFAKFVAQRQAALCQNDNKTGQKHYHKH